MGWCHEFGVTVREGCGHPMRAGEAACECPECGIVCEGQFNGCATVWAAGPREVVLVRPQERVKEHALLSAQVPVEEEVVASVQAPVAEPVMARVEVLAAASNGVTHQVHTAWPLTETQARIWLESSPARNEEHVEAVVEMSAVGAAASSTPATDGMRGQIFEWLQDSFEGLNAQMRVLADNLSRQQQALAEVSDSHAAAGRLSQLADALPERIGTAVQEAVTAGRRSSAAEAAHIAGLDGGVEPGEIEPVEIEAVHVEPVQIDPVQIDPVQIEPGPVDESELSRLVVTAGRDADEAERDWRAAFDDVMIDFRESSEPREPGETSETSESGETSEPGESETENPDLADIYVGAPSTDPHGEAVPGVRTQLTGLASTVQSRINRSGWQEKLRSLSTR